MEHATTSQLRNSAEFQLTVQRWRAIRKEAAAKIDPETAEIGWAYAYEVDPYGLNPDLPEELQTVGRARFARSPGTDVWVWFGDLPDATESALWKRLGYGAEPVDDGDIQF
jgi:hypothetical protein